MSSCRLDHRSGGRIQDRVEGEACQEEDPEADEHEGRQPGHGGGVAVSEEGLAASSARSGRRSPPCGRSRMRHTARGPRRRCPAPCPAGAGAGVAALISSSMTRVALLLRDAGGDPVSIDLDGHEDEDHEDRGKDVGRDEVLLVAAARFRVGRRGLEGGGRGDAAAVAQRDARPAQAIGDCDGGRCGPHQRDPLVGGGRLAECVKGEVAIGAREMDRRPSSLSCPDPSFAAGGSVDDGDGADLPFGCAASARRPGPGEGIEVRSEVWRPIRGKVGCRCVNGEVDGLSPPIDLIPAAAG